jgi:Ca2+-binding EF-hand superfamily protein
MIMALNGFYDHELTVEDAFRANDKDTSGFLDRLEVQCAVAMLGYLVPAPVN